MAENVVANSQDTNATNFIQPKCKACTEEVQKKEEEIADEQETPEVQRSSHLATYPDESNEGVASQLKSSKGSGHDFSNVRIHSGSAAVQMDQQLNAKAFTNGSDTYFDQGEYQTASTVGKKLLAHELTHVVQQNLSTKGIQRQEGDNEVGALPTYAESLALSQFSVNRDDYESLIVRALNRMSEQRAQRETFAPLILPMLVQMSRNPQWIDQFGNVRGGGAVSYTFPNTNVSLNLTLILDDGIPQTTGRFTHDASNGQIRLLVRRNSNADELAETLFHESLHLVAWMIRTHGPVFAQGIQGRAVRNLDISRHQQLVSTVASHLTPIVATVNVNRSSHISPDGLQRAAQFIVDEVIVRVETDVFMLTTGTVHGLLAEPDIGFLRNYLFNHSHVFRPSDASSLTTREHRSLIELVEILRSFYNNALRIRSNFGSNAASSQHQDAIEDIQNETYRGPLGGPRP